MSSSVAEKPASGFRRIPELDALRGLAALAIVFTHLPRGFWFGETAVDLFFVLSGYLITSIIVKNCRKPHFLSTFYARRCLRIWPIYYLAIVGVVLLNSLRGSPDPMNALPWYLLYLQNAQKYWGGMVPPMDNALGHTWTLAIEEQFYLLWPALVIWVGRKQLRPLAIAVAVLPAVLRGIGLDRCVLLGHCDGLAMGALLASLEADAVRSSVKSRGRAYLATALVSFSAYWGLWFYLSAHGFTGKRMVAYNPSIILVTLSYFGLIGFVVCNVGNERFRWLRLPALAYLGQISYGLYLYHWIVYSYIDMKIKFGLGFQDPWWLDVIKVAVSFIVAVASWHFVEQPILTLKDRFSYREKPSRERESYPIGALGAAVAAAEAER